MKQVYLKLLLCLLLTISATGQYITGQQRMTQQFGTGQTDFGNYGIISGRSGNVLTAEDMASYDPQLVASASPWSQYTGVSSYTQQPIQNNVKQQPAATVGSASLASKFQVTQKDQSNNAALTSGSSYGTYSNYNPYTEPTGPPYGIQSTGEILAYQPEKLDISKCGPQSPPNPCKLLGPQYYELPGYPECYIQCAFGRMFVKPCPTDLVWNPRIKNCDWKTVAPASSDSEYSTTMHDNNENRIGSTSYGTVNRNYDAVSYSYGRNKRSTTERKKRFLMAGSPQYQGLMLKSDGQSQYPNYYGTSVPHQNGQLRIPLVPFNLPGPVSYPAKFGIPSLSPQVATQQYFPTIAAPGVSAGPASPFVVARSYTGFDGSFASPFSAPTRTVSEAVAPTSAPVTQATATTTPAPTIGTVPQPSAVAPSTASNVATVPAMPPLIYQPNPATYNPYAAPTPVSLQATLIPGPLYPYGPPLGGPFGGPLPKPIKPVSVKARSNKDSPSGKSKPSETIQITKHFGNEATTNAESFSVQPFGSFLGQTAQPFGSFLGQTAQPFGSFASQSPALLRSLDGQPLTFGTSFAGQYPSSVMPFALPSFQSHLTSGNPYLSNFRLLNFPGRRELADADEEDESPLGFEFDSYLSNKGASEDDSVVETDDASAENTSTEVDSEEASTDDSNDSRRNRIYNWQRMPNIYNVYMEDQPREEDDAESYSGIFYRAKRQYNPYFSTSEQATILSASPHDSTKQQHLAASKLPRQPSIAASPCLTKPPRTYTAHPTDPTKYVACFNQFYYQVMDCPSSLIYNSITNKCEKRKGLESICEREQPCMNDGQCYQTGPKAYKCTCRGGWTGERCETQLSTCVNNPCGQGNECLTLKTSYGKQDYVCLCNEGQSYGLSCGQNTRPNPCLSSSTEQEQYYPFEYSSEAFIQCNGDILHVQRCPSGLHWNPVEQVCDVAVTVPSISHERQLQSYDFVYNNEQQQLLNTPRTILSQQKNTNANLLPTNNLQAQRNLPRPSNSYLLAQDQPALGRSLLSPKPLEKPDIIKTSASKPRYAEVLDDTPALSYLHQQPMRPLPVKN